MYGYVEAKLISPSGDILKDICDAIHIDIMPLDKLHMTLMYDERNIIEEQHDRTLRYLAVPVEMTVLGQGKWQSIALSLYAPKAVAYHEELKSLGFRHSYSDFLPHMSLKYQPSLAEVERLIQVEDIFADIPLFFELQPFKATKDD